MTEPTHPWRSVCVDRDGLDAGEARVPATGAASVELAGVGRPLPGFGVRIAGGGVGPIEVRGPSMLDRYTDDTVPVGADGWLTTMDLGFVHDGELHVVGRRDDVLVVAGRQLHAHDLEDAAAVAGTRPGSVMVVRGPDGHPVVLFEPARDASLDPSALSRLCAAISAERARGERRHARRRAGLPAGHAAADAVGQAAATGGRAVAARRLACRSSPPARRPRAGRDSARQAGRDRDRLSHRGDHRRGRGRRRRRRRR